MSNCAGRLCGDCLLSRCINPAKKIKAVIEARKQYICACEYCECDIPVNNHGDLCEFCSTDACMEDAVNDGCPEIYCYRDCADCSNYPGNN